MSRIIVLLMFTITSVWANPQIVGIKKGEVAQFDGFIINYEMEKNFRLINEENINLKKINITLKDLQVTQEQTIEILNKRLVSSQDLNDKFLDRIHQQESQSFWEKSIFFLGGAVITGALAVGVSRGLR